MRAGSVVAVDLEVSALQRCSPSAQFRAFPLPVKSAGPPVGILLFHLPPGKVPKAQGTTIPYVVPGPGRQLAQVRTPLGEETFMSHFDVPFKPRLQSDAQRLHLGPVRYLTLPSTSFCVTVTFFPLSHFPPSVAAPLNSSPAGSVSPSGQPRVSAFSEANFRRRMEIRGKPIRRRPWRGRHNKHIQREMDATEESRDTAKGLSTSWQWR
ncbi:hypothetical protein BDP55DRAFT_70500 [Colletotrichum godetiae]|uniref:Uncharacterized protein n=1 Tax=Colletotrichum godetiae TaxID=1209918 RepID=A0AAJ0AP85_9PEZI|nr:uncharacterized protein BDP55DRAFT_70500 [Colletotrichum godetiae]KAK1687846.1 hypothetical protein BDP55DRAFT_70500 [Colletotrichum godetiae]